MSKILFVTYGGGHVTTLVPIIKRLRDYTNYDLEIIGLTTSGNMLASNQIKYTQMKDFADADILDIGKALANRFHEEGKGISYEETVAYYGAGMRDLIREHGTEKAYAIFEKAGRKTFLPVYTMQNIIKQIQPDMVITTSSPRFELATLIAARSLEVPALRIEQFYATGEVSVPEGIIFCAMNDLVRDRLICQGIKGEYIHVTGQPAFDDLISIKNRVDVEEIGERLGITKQQKIVLWASQKTESQNELLAELLKIEKYNKDMMLIIKPHPNENIELHQNAIKDAESGARIVNSNLHELILLADIVVTEFSTVGLETIFLDKPLITVNITGKPDIVPYAESGAAIGVYNMPDLEETIKSVLCYEDIQQKLANCRKSYKNDGQASKRICELIDKILGGGTTK